MSEPEPNPHVSLNNARNLPRAGHAATCVCEDCTKAFIDGMKGFKDFVKRKRQIARASRKRNRT